MSKRKTMTQRRQEFAAGLNRAKHHAREAGIMFGYRMASVKNDTDENRRKENYHEARSGEAVVELMAQFNAAVRAAHRPTPQTQVSEVRG